jgi:hypothetical protein
LNDVWPLVHGERAALIRDLAGLDDRQRDEPSLCAGWSVHDVVAHRAVVPALRHQARTRASLGGAEELVSRVRLVATDAEVALGHGPEVRGPVLDLLLVACGRPAGQDLDGPGLHHV